MLNMNGFELEMIEMANTENFSTIVAGTKNYVDTSKFVFAPITSFFYDHST